MRIVWLVLERQTITYEEIRLALQVWAMKFWNFLLVHYPKVIPKECLSLALVHLPFRTGTLHCCLICTARSCLGCTNIKNYCHNHMRALGHACAHNNGKQHPAFTIHLESWEAGWDDLSTKPPTQTKGKEWHYHNKGHNYTSLEAVWQSR